MRATRWSLVVMVVALVAACASEPANVVAPEPPPATAVAPEPSEAPGPALVEVPTEPVGPVVAVPAVADPVVPVLPGAAPAATEDDPVPEGAPRPVTPGRSAAGGAVAPGAVQAASAKTAGRPAPTGRIEIPAIGLNHPTYEGVDLGTLQYGPGHWPGTPLPGHRGNTVFPGHRTTHSRPFWDIDKLRPGHDVIFTTPAGRFTYKVTQSLIVGSHDTWVVNNTTDATFTILACHPKGSARQRYVVKGALASAPAAPPTTRPPATTPTTRRKFLGIL